MTTKMEDFNIPSLIQKKRDGAEFGKDEIQYFVQLIKNGEIQECQIGALLMAIYMKGMSLAETLSLTGEMMTSGEMMQWPEEWCSSVVDKHSTGGVGDKVSLPLAPALAAAGCKVPMISGRGLGHTGGTLDKLESVPGFNVDQTSEQMVDILKTVGCCIVGQTESLVPVDRILYKMRDVTSTVESLPLITSSIMSKKGAESLSALVLDVKYGSAAICKTRESARTLARSLIQTGTCLGIHTRAVLSKMDSPIGQKIGNSLEVIESLECLKGRGPADLRELVECLGGILIWMCEKADSFEKGRKIIQTVLDNGSALQKFQDMMKAQGVTPEHANTLCQTENYFKVFKPSKCKEELHTTQEGIVNEIYAMPIAEVLRELGAGRTKTDDPINYSVGAELLITVGERVTKGTPWVRIHHDAQKLTEAQKSLLQTALSIGDRPVSADNRISEIMIPDSISWSELNGDLDSNRNYIKQNNLV
ncbi:thymidine phosphorylase [Protopterus annectens]|uniref:thymidine phosphorylase n=1 Tax=Protopterus annectens TaxID=7888 RepID=UPI001CFA7F0B|nr:thymidine phosphorylase [Protopterus annectens]